MANSNAGQEDRIANVCNTFLAYFKDTSPSAAILRNPGFSMLVNKITRIISIQNKVLSLILSDNFGFWPALLLPLNAPHQVLQEGDNLSSWYIFLVLALRFLKDGVSDHRSNFRP